MRVHILGASGSGTSTLGLALAEHLGVAWYDTDDYYWLPTDPPFETKWPMPERLARLRSDLDAAGDWVLSGSLCGWGDPLIVRFELVVLLRADTGVRLRRLAAREAADLGAEAIAPDWPSDGIAGLRMVFERCGRAAIDLDVAELAAS